MGCCVLGGKVEPRNRMSGSCAVISIQISFLALHRYKTKNYSRGSIYNTSHQKILGQSTCYFSIWPPGGYNHLQNPGEGTGRRKILSSSKVVRIKGGQLKFIGEREGSEKKEEPHGHYSISIVYSCF